MAKKIALGKGLGALLGDTDKTGKVKPKTESSAIGSSINEIKIATIEVNPFQPRTDFDKEALNELAESIKVQGIIQPITVRKLNENTYQLISGERRLQASKLAGLSSIPAYIREANDQQMLEMGLIENIQRENLNAMEIALSYQRLISECNLKQEELGGRVGKNRSTVTNYLRLLKLAPDVQAAIRDGKISMGHARALVGAKSTEIQITALNHLLKDELSVRKIEQLIRDLNGNESKNSRNNSTQNKSTTPSFEIKKLQSDLSSHFGTKVVVSASNKGKGEIKIPFVSTDDLNRILEIIK